MNIRYFRNDPVKIGDIICVRDGKSFVARGIQWFLRIYKRKKNIEAVPNYHHNGIIVEVWGRLFVAEAAERGFKLAPLSEAYDEYSWLNRIDIITPNMPYTEEEKKKICEKATFYNMKITRYDFLNFLFQIYLILFGKWIGPKGQKAENRFYCSEAVATITNYTRPGTFPNPAATNPVDVAINPEFHLL